MIRPIHFQFWGDLAEPSYQLSGLIHLQWIYQKLNIDLTITLKKKGGGWKYRCSSKAESDGSLSLIWAAIAHFNATLTRPSHYWCQDCRRLCSVILKLLQAVQTFSVSLQFIKKAETELWYKIKGTNYRKEHLNTWRIWFEYGEVKKTRLVCHKKEDRELRLEVKCLTEKNTGTEINRSQR